MLIWAYDRALQALPAKSAYLNGELCALNADGMPVFGRLQAPMDGGRIGGLFVFDRLCLNGGSRGYIGALLLGSGR